MVNCCKDFKTDFLDIVTPCFHYYTAYISIANRKFSTECRNRKIFISVQ